MLILKRISIELEGEKMNQNGKRTLNKKIRELLTDYEEHYSHKFEGYTETGGIQTDLKEGTIIIDMHTSDAFLTKSLETLINTLATSQYTRRAKYNLLFWDCDDVNIEKQNVKIQEIEGLLPLSTYDKKEQTDTETLRVMSFDTKKSNLVFIISDMNFLVMSPQGDIHKYMSIKDRIIWIMNYSNRENVNQCVNINFLRLKNCVQL